MYLWHASRTAGHPKPTMCPNAERHYFSTNVGQECPKGSEPDAKEKRSRKFVNLPTFRVTDDFELYLSSTHSVFENFPLFSYVPSCLLQTCSFMELNSHKMNEIFLKLAVFLTNYIVSLLYVSYFRIMVRMFSWDTVVQFQLCVILQKPLILIGLGYS